MSNFEDIFGITDKTIQTTTKSSSNYEDVFGIPTGTYKRGDSTFTPTATPELVKKPSFFERAKQAAYEASPFAAAKKIKEFVAPQAKFAIQHPVTAAKNVITGLTTAGFEKDVYNATSAFLYTTFYAKQNDEILKQSMEQSQKLLEQAKKTNNPERKAQLLKLSQDIASKNPSVEAANEIIANDRKPSQVLFDAGMMLVNILTAGTYGVVTAEMKAGQLAGAAGLREAGQQILSGSVKKGLKTLTSTQAASVVIDTIKEPLWKSIMKSAGIGATYGAIGAGQEGATTVGEFGRGAAFGAAAGVAIDLGVKGAGKALEGISGKMAETAERKELIKSLTPSFTDHIITGVDNPKFKTEILNNGKESKVIVSSLSDSFKNLGEDISVLESKGIMGNVDKESLHAGGLVYDKMSSEAKSELKAEVDLMVADKSMSEKDKFAYAISHLLKYNDSREIAPKLGQYMDSVLGVVNPEIDNMEKGIADFKVNFDKTQAEAPKFAPTTKKMFQPGTKIETPSTVSWGGEVRVNEESLNKAIKDDFSAGGTYIGNEINGQNAALRKLPGETLEDFTKRYKKLYVEYETLVKKAQDEIGVPTKENSRMAAQLADQKASEEFIRLHPEMIEKTTPTGAPTPTAPKGEMKTAGVATSIEQKAIEKKITSEFENLAEYETVNVKEQAAKSAELITKDIEMAKKIITGEEKLPSGLRAGMFIKGMEEYATKTGDVDLLRDIASSPLVSETSVHAQELRLLAERNPESPLTAMKQIKDTRIAAAEKRTGKKIDEAMKETTKEIKESIPKITTEKWNQFINEIRC